MKHLAHVGVKKQIRKFKEIRHVSTASLSAALDSLGYGYCMTAENSVTGQSIACLVNELCKNLS